MVGDPPHSTSGKSPYPKLDDFPHTHTHTDKLSDTQADKTSDNSEDSGVVVWNDPKSVLDTNRRMLEKQLSCDVMFYVGENREKLGGHKYVLMTRSEVFLDMFNSDPDKHDFDVPDISPDYFWEVLRHIYCETQKLQVLNVVGILVAADKYKLPDLRTACLDYLHACLEISNACYLLVEVHKYRYFEEEKKIVSFTRKNASDVFESPGLVLLSEELIDMLLKLPDINLDENEKTEVMSKWSSEKRIQRELLHSNSREILNDPMQDCLYVEREDDDCHRYIMDSVTTRSLFDEPEEIVAPENAEIPPLTDVPDGMSTISSTSSMKSRSSSVHTYSRLPSCNMWPELDQVTRLQEVHGVGVNDAKYADAITFTVDQNIYLFGFGIYGPKKEGEGRYKVDTIMYRKKREVVMESITIRGAGVILPVLFEKPVKVDKGVRYSLEIYITGPNSHMGSSGQGTISHKGMLFTFSNCIKVKHNRCKVSEGQIPRLFFMQRKK